MKVTLVANVGQRDLQENGHPLPSKTLRDVSKEILNQLAERSDNLNAPMLSAALEFIARQHNDQEDLCLHLTLIATDQEESSPEYCAGDTKYCAQILKDWLRENFEKKFRWEEPTILYIKKAPNKYDEMIKLFSNWAEKDRFKLAQADQRYLLCTGGTPACNMALLLIGISHYRENCQVLYVDENGGLSEPLNVDKQLLALYRAERLEALLRSWDFSAIKLDTSYPEGVRKLAAAATARLNFDFENSLKQLESWTGDLAQEFREKLRPLQSEIKQLNPNQCTIEKVFPELYWNAVIKWEREEYADFLGRVFRLREETLRFAMKKFLGLDINEDPYKDDNGFRNWVENQPNLKEMICKKGWRVRPSPDVLLLILQQLSDQQPELKPLTEAIDKVNALASLRNKSIIAHGMEGITRKDIEDRLKEKEDISLLLKNLVEAVGAVVESNPFQKFADLIRDVEKRCRYQY